MAGLVGQQLGNYRLTRLLGQGGFADVYLGEHVHLRTQAAIKVLQMRLVESNTEQFLTEARIIAHLVHPHIVRVLDFGVQDTVPFLVMDYAPHGTIRQRYLQGKPLPPSTLFPAIGQVASALQYAHDKKFIHRDVKPENMLLGPSNDVLLSDFGLVLIAQNSSSRTPKEMAGTVSYMAPEQLRGEPSAASDQYALGIVVYEWLTGERPFTGTFFEVASQHMMVPPPSLREKVPTISPEVESVVMTALAKNPHERFARIEVFAIALSKACQAAGQYPPDLSDATSSSAHTSQVTILADGTPSPLLALKQSAQDTSAAVAPGSPTPQSYQGAVVNPPSQLALQAQHLSPSHSTRGQPEPRKKTGPSRTMIVVVVLLVVVVASSVGIFFAGANRSTTASTGGTPNLSNHIPTVATTAANTYGQGTVAATSSPGQANASTATQTATQEATAAARVTASASNPNANPYSPNTGKLVLNDPLNRNNYNWQTYNSGDGNACQFSGNALHAMSAGNYGGPCWAQATDFANFTYEIQMTFLKVGKQFSGGGIAFRSSGSTYYYFEIFESGKYSFTSCSGNDCSQQIAGYPTQGQAIPSFNTALGQPNTIAVVANGSTFTIYVNGKIAVGPVNDTKFTHGMIGVYSEGGSEGGAGAATDIAFANAKVWQM